jgi:hypothetical protein
MGQNELTDKLAEFMRKHGDAPLNPLGKQGSRELRMAHFQIRAVLRHRLDEPCDIDGFRHMSWFDAGMRTLLMLYVSGEAWAVKEVHNRAFGRVPVALDVTVDQRDDLAEMSTADLVRRAEELAATARALIEAPIDSAPIDAAEGEVTEEDDRD